MRARKLRSNCTRYFLWQLLTSSVNDCAKSMPQTCHYAYHFYLYISFYLYDFREGIVNDCPEYTTQFANKEY